MASIRDDFSVQAVGQGLLVALVGYASSVAVVIQGLTAVGASVPQVASALVVARHRQGHRGDRLELVDADADLDRRGRRRASRSSRPSGAVSGGFPAAVAAFMAVGALIMLTGPVVAARPARRRDPQVRSRAACWPAFCSSSASRRSSRSARCRCLPARCWRPG